MNKNLIPIIADVAVLDRYYDAWRIIDPNKKTILVGSRHSEIVSEENCYNMWLRNEVCTNCISSRALMENQIFRKLEYVGNQLYFIKAVPIEVNEERYVIELIQNVTDSSIMDSILGSLPTIEEMTRTIEQLNDAVYRDALTGVYNKRYIMEKLPAEIIATRLEKSFLTVGMADIDHFKRVNDQYGHLVGDEVLKFFASTLAANLRKTDWVARYGGEEFLLLIRGASKEKAYQVAEKLRKVIEELEFATTAGPIHITASFGLQAISQSDNNIDQIIAQADRNLYRAKQLGRNRVVLS